MKFAAGTDRTQEVRQQEHPEDLTAWIHTTEHSGVSEQHQFGKNTAMSNLHKSETQKQLKSPQIFKSYFFPL